MYFHIKIVNVLYVNERLIHDYLAHYIVMVVLTFRHKFFTLHFIYSTKIKHLFSLNVNQDSSFHCAHEKVKNMEHFV